MITLHLIARKDLEASQRGEAPLRAVCGGRFVGTDNWYSRFLQEWDRRVSLVVIHHD